MPDPYDGEMEKGNGQTGAPGPEPLEPTPPGKGPE
jgi:hypothetical protein